MFPKDNLLTFWKLDDLKDSRGNRYTLTNNGGVQFVAGKIGNCAEFTANNYLTTSQPFNIVGAFSVSCWCKIPTLSPNNDVILNQYNGFVIFVNSAGKAVLSDYSSYGVESTNQVIFPNTWHHWTVTSDGTTKKLYIDNVIVATTTNRLDLAFEDQGDRSFGIAGNTVDGGYNSKFVDAVGIWNRALTLQEIQTLYNNGNGLEPEEILFLEDSSTNNFQLSAFGNAALNTTTFKYGSGSAYFGVNDGSYLQSESSENFGLGTGNFTIEMWMYKNTPISFWNGFFSINRYNNNGILIRIQPDSDALYVGGPSYDWNAPSNFPLNQWNHFALVRNDGVIKIYVNGNEVFTANNSNDLGSTGIVTIGASSHAIAEGFGGYIDDLRITKGVARYTSNFTPPQQQLLAPSDTYGDNVSLLLHMDQNKNQFVDLSKNELPITFDGVRSSIQVFKYGNSSIYFPDPNSNYDAQQKYGIQIPSLSSINYETEDFTYEFWFYAIESTPPSQTLIANWNSPIYSFFIGLNNSLIYFSFNAGTAGGIASNVSYNINQWYHLAISRNLSSIKMFLNGSEVGSYNIGSNPIYFDSKNIRMGWPNGAGFFNGYMDDIRITRGVGRYETNFTPPSARLSITEDPYFDNVYLLLQSNNNRPFTDFSTNNFTLTAFGDAQISTSVKKFGSGAGYFDGNGDYLEIVDDEVFNFGTGDFTVEGWVNVSAFTSDHFMINSVNSAGLFFGWRNQTDIGWGRCGVAWDYSTPSGMVTNTWYHIALTRNQSAMRLFVNGQQVGTTQTNTLSYDLGIGGVSIAAQTGFYFNGYIDELRVTKGVARYTANFVPQTAPFANPVSIPSGALAFWKLDDLNDSSGNGNTLTNNGSVQFVAGKIGNCAEFNGTNWLRANVPLSFSQNPITISMWIDIAPYPFNDSNGLYTVFMGHYGFNIWINNQNVLKSDNYAAANNLLSTLSEGFSHIVLVIENGIHTLWVNGQQVYSGPHNYNDIPFFYLGAGYVNFLNPTQRDLALGKMDAVGIWNRALTLQEIQTLYNNGNGLE